MLIFFATLVNTNSRASILTHMQNLNAQDTVIVAQFSHFTYYSSL